MVVGWVVTIVTLIVLDDLVFGPIFWALARWQGSAVAATVAFVVYFVAQIFIVHQGTRPEPHRLAAFFLRRLRLERGSPPPVVTRRRSGPGCSVPARRSC